MLQHASGNGAHLSRNRKRRCLVVQVLVGPFPTENTEQWGAVEATTNHSDDVVDACFKI